MTKPRFVACMLAGLFAIAIAVIFLLCFYNPYPLYFREEIEFAGEKYGVSPALVASIIFAESSFRTDAKSNRGAVGLMQLLPSTAEWLCARQGESFSEEMLTNPLYNIELGTYYLSYLFEKFENETAVLAAYNAGEGNVRLWLLNTTYSADGEGLTTTPYKETNEYIKKVKKAERRYLKIMNNEQLRLRG